MSPRRPRMRPSLPTLPIRSGVASATSNSSQPASMRSTRSSPPTSSAPAAFASWALSPWANTATRTILPVPCGSTTVPRTIWSAWRGSTPRRMWASTDGSNLTLEVSFSRRHRIVDRIDLVAVDELGERPGSACRVAHRGVLPWRPGWASPCRSAGWTGRLRRGLGATRPAPAAGLAVATWQSDDLDAHRAGRALDDRAAAIEGRGR